MEKNKIYNMNRNLPLLLYSKYTQNTNFNRNHGT